MACGNKSNQRLGPGTLPNTCTWMDAWTHACGVLGPTHRQNKTLVKRQAGIQTDSQADRQIGISIPGPTPSRGLGDDNGPNGHIRIDKRFT